MVTYPVHGISGFPDHLVTHAVVKRVYLELLEHGATCLQRLAYFTLDEEHAQSGLHRLTSSKPEDIDCRMQLSPSDIAACNRALDCYESYQETIEQSGVRNLLHHDALFEIHGEHHAPPLANLCDF